MKIRAHGRVMSVLAIVFQTASDCKPTDTCQAQSSNTSPNQASSSGQCKTKQCPASIASQLGTLVLSTSSERDLGAVAEFECKAGNVYETVRGIRDKVS